MKRTWEIVSYNCKNGHRQCPQERRGRGKSSPTTAKMTTTWHLPRKRKSSPGVTTWYHLRKRKQAHRAHKIINGRGHKLWSLVYIGSVRNIFQPRVLNNAHLVGKKRESWWLAVARMVVETATERGQGSGFLDFLCKIAREGGDGYRL